MKRANSQSRSSAPNRPARMRSAAFRWPEAFLLSLCWPTFVGPAFDLFAEFLYLPVKFQRIKRPPAPCKAWLIPALLRQVRAMPTAEIVPPWCFIKLCYSPATINTIFAKRADKPVPNTAKVTGRSCQAHLIIIIGLFAGVAISNGVVKANIFFTFKR